MSIKTDILSHLVDNFVETVVFATEEDPPQTGTNCSQHTHVVRRKIEQRTWLQVHLTMGIRRES